MQEISHKGRVVSIDKYVTQVEIIQTSACGTCHAKGLCGYSDSKTKVVPVPTNAFAMLNEGDEVELCMKPSMGAKAVWIAYVIPLLVLMLAVLVSSACHLPELYTGLCAIAAVAVYYMVIFCFRKRLNNDFVFYIK
ncbi:MAG: SoxR reducing system RseC family protein [Bacteroidales bacterium]|nr:SoxR reducing system RseC family protein [Bacteroidales bacterium]